MLFSNAVNYHAFIYGSYGSDTPYAAQRQPTKLRLNDPNSTNVLASDTPYAAQRQPTKLHINDPNLKLELVGRGLQLPTQMAFLGPDDILVLQKDNGIVKRIVNGVILQEPILDVNVATAYERGLLGIAIAKNHNETAPNPIIVYLYYTESQQDGKDKCSGSATCSKENQPLGNRLYRYELVNNKLVNPKLLLDLPATPGAVHNGGAILIGPDNNMYIPIGEINYRKGQISNYKNGSPPDGRGGILRVTQDGQPTDGILGDSIPLRLYYAYGIRNSFGLDFDPVTGKLWDTENGPGFGDEINLVEPGFNSGWSRVQGIWERENYFGGPVAPDKPDKLVDFDGKGKYSTPEFTWNQTLGVTAIKFLNSDKLGKEYQNDIFVGDIHTGNLYHFDLSKDRKQLLLNGSLEDRIANNKNELQKVILGQGFSGITDIEVGPDGYLYILSFGNGEIYRIVPK
jgi:glucose/arabinose dehydrogenase